MDRREELVCEIQQLREQYQQEVSVKNRPWPKSIRIRALELQRLEVSNGEISQLTGIPVATLYYWRTSGGGRRPSLKKKQVFHPVEVRQSKENSSETKSQNREEQKAQDLAMTLPSGIVITGLTPVIAIQIVRGLRA